MTFPAGYQELRSIREAAKSCRVSKSTAQRWIAEAAFLPVAKLRKVRRATKMSRVLPLVEESLLKDPFRTCSDLSKVFQVSKELIRQCFHRLGFSCKRARYYGVAKNGRQLARTFLERRDAYSFSHLFWHTQRIRSYNQGIRNKLGE